MMKIKKPPNDCEADDVSRMRMVPIEQNCRMAPSDFIKNMPQPTNTY